MAAVMIGVDPHKASHTAVAIGAAEEPLGELRVRACGETTATLGREEGQRSRSADQATAPEGTSHPAEKTDGTP
jgi:hypothetical protein